MNFKFVFGGLGAGGIGNEVDLPLRSLWMGSFPIRKSRINCAFSAKPLSGACLEWIENCRSFRGQFINGGIGPDQLNAVNVGCEGMIRRD